ncbi:MAG: GNAT family N-acetyltransferase [Clostridia bacterium]|nr:GNAT family N-acetyltransferase [Clostridia bacterium]MBR1586675.1 GNAT family N-acetyltransferase [Clostridia bacterium]
MEIITERLRLAPLNEQYLQTAFAYGGDPKNTKYMVFLPFLSLEETREFLRACEQEWEKTQPTAYEFAVLLNGVHIGGVSLYLNEARDTGELGWILHPEHQGRGYAAEATRALMDFAVTRLSVQRFEAHCDTKNLPSRRVMEKLGMRLISRTGGRKNRGSDEERQEYLYALDARDVQRDASSC